MTSPFSKDALVAACQAAIAEDQPQLAVRDVLVRTMGDAGPRAAVADALPAVDAGIVPLHVADDLTVLQVVWGPGMELPAHDHRMWAAIGIYTGGEDNALYRRTPDGIVESGGKELRDGDVLVLGDDAIHSVQNPLPSYTGAIHVYGGDFFATPRSQWIDPASEQPYDHEVIRQLFEASNASDASTDT